MESLNYYTEKKVQDAVKKHGAFFAFGDGQLHEGMAKGKELSDYCSMGVGLICLKDTAADLAVDLRRITEEGIAERLKDFGKEKIIEYELNNYESAYTMDTSDAKEALKGYGVTDEEIAKVFRTMVG